MKEVFPLKIVPVLLSIIIPLVLNACMMPSDIAPLINDDRVQELISGNGVTVQIEPPQIEDRKPVLSVGDTITVTSGVPETVTVTNISTAGYTSISWYCNEITLTAVGTIGDVLTIENNGTAPFDEPGSYIVTVVGITAGGIPYSTWFNVIIN